MQNEELYPELADYIFNYCGKYFWENEKLANRHLNTLAKSNAANTAMYKVLQQRQWISNDPAVLELAKNGFEEYKRKVTERIFNEHKHELELNLCPICGKIARTPIAKQCRFCFHDWH
jgi:hypothetical protein